MHITILGYLLFYKSLYNSRGHWRLVLSRYASLTVLVEGIELEEGCLQMYC